MPLTRSYLFVPAGDARKVEKALASAADALILDLEDATHPDQKEDARRHLRQVLAGLPPDWRGPRIYVRANAIGTPWWEEDIRALALPPVAGFVLPKVERAADLKAAAARLLAAERAQGLAPGHFALLPMMETAAGLLAAPQVARAPRVERLIFGALDMALDLSCTWVPAPHQFLYHRAQLALVSRVAGIGAPVDSVWPHIDDLAGLEAECRVARDLGFAGKTLIHPKHIEVANRVFSPTPEEVEWARRVLAATAGAAVARVDGAMVDRPVIERARRILAQVEAQP